MTDQGGQTGSIIPFDELEHTVHSHEFVGAERGDVPFSVILVHSQPGAGPKSTGTPTPRCSWSSRARRRFGSATRR